MQTFDVLVTVGDRKYHVQGKVTHPGHPGVWASTMAASMQAESPEMEFTYIQPEGETPLDVDNGINDDLFDSLVNVIACDLDLP